MSRLRDPTRSQVGCGPVPFCSKRVICLREIKPRPSTLQAEKKCFWYSDSVYLHSTMIVRSAERSVTSVSMCGSRLRSEPSSAVATHALAEDLSGIVDRESTRQLHKRPWIADESIEVLRLGALPYKGAPPVRIVRPDAAL